MDVDFHLNNTYFGDPRRFDGINIFQIGRLFAKSTTVINEHLHGPLFELTVVTSGKGTVSTNNIPTNVSRGDIYLSFPGDLHKIESDRLDPLKFDFLAFTAEHEELSIELKRISKEYADPCKRLFADERISDLLSNAIMEMSDEKPLSHIVLSSIFKQILVYTVRSFSDCAHGIKGMTKSEILCYSIMNYIDTHIYSIGSLEEIASFTGYSYGYISGVFRRVTSGTLSDYYHNRKLEEARTLITKSNYTLTEIAAMLNYSSVYALSKSFSKRFLLSPREYRKRYKT